MASTGSSSSAASAAPLGVASVVDSTRSNPPMPWALEEPAVSSAAGGKSSFARCSFARCSFARCELSCSE